VPASSSSRASPKRRLRQRTRGAAPESTSERRDGLLLNSFNLPHSHFYGNRRTKVPNILQGVSLFDFGEERVGTLALGVFIFG
jgi:hypothetical protein